MKQTVVAVDRRFFKCGPLCGLLLVAGIVLGGVGQAADPVPGAEPDPISIQKGDPPMDPAAVIATVNDETVTLEELNREMTLMLSRMSSQPLPPQVVEQMRPQLEPQAFNQIVLKIVLKAYAVANNITVSDASIEGEISQILAQFPSELVFEQALAQQGMTKDSLKGQIENQMLISTAVDHYMETLPEPTDDSLKTYYDTHAEEYKTDETVAASHILIGFEPTDTDTEKGAKKAQAEVIRKQLVDGADFAALAKEHSSCPSSAQGGSLGEFGKGQMVPPFEKAAFELEPGGISEVVETQFGYHLITVTKHDQGSTPSFDEAKERVEKAVNEEKLESWFEGLIAQAKIERN